MYVYVYVCICVCMYIYIYIYIRIYFHTYCTPDLSFDMTLSCDVIVVNHFSHRAIAFERAHFKRQ